MRLTAFLFTVALWSIVLSPLASCSPSSIQRQRVAEASLATANNTAVDIIASADGVFNRQRKDACDAACGHAMPCADPDACNDAVQAVTDKWKPVRAVWTIAHVAVEAWRKQLAACGGQTDAGTPDWDAGDCTVRLDALAAEAAAHITDLRCALVGLGVADPMGAMGPAVCGGDAGP